MNTILENLQDAIRQSIEKFSSDICDRYDNVEASELERIWNNVSSNFTIKVTFNSKDEDKCSVVTTKSAKSKATTSEVYVDGRCPYKYTKGTNNNKFCNAKPKDDMKHCGRHTKWENATPKPKEPPSKSDKSTSRDRILRRNKDINNMLWHSETKLVFENIMKKSVVIGVFRNLKVRKLEEQDIDTCKLWGFPFDENYLKETVDSKDADVSMIEDEDTIEDKTPVEPVVESKPKKTVKPKTSTKGPISGRKTKVTKKKSEEKEVSADDSVEDILKGIQRIKISEPDDVAETIEDFKSEDELEDEN